MNKFKNILSGVLAASILASLAVFPVYADYTPTQYDMEHYNLPFDDGTTVNAIDGTQALKFSDIPADELNSAGYKEIFTKTFNTSEGFFLSFDFCVDEANKDTFLIELPQYNSAHAKIDKVGPIISYGYASSKNADVLQLRTQTGGSSWQLLGDITFGDWYTAEIEGRTGVGAEHTTFRLYNSSHQLVQETKNFNMRNISSNNLSFNTMQIKNADIDNVKLLAVNPDAIELSSVSDELNAGQSLAFDYTMLKNDAEFTKHAVEWSVSGNNVSINNGVLTAAIDAPNQKVTVTASVTFNEKVLSASKDITIKAVDTSDEPFDAASVSGADTVKAGTTSEYTVSATKNGSPATLSEGDVVWSVWDYANTFPYYDESYTGQKIIDVTDGTLTVNEKALPQTITLRASTPSGKVFGYKTVNISWADSQTEKVIVNRSFDDAETVPASVNKAVGADGSIAYSVPALEETKFGNQEGYTLTELDIKFTQEGSGYVLRRNDLAKINTSILYKNGNIATDKGTLVTGAELNTWYHLEMLYSTNDASCNIYKYNDDGTLGEPQTCLDIDKQNAAQYGAYRLLPGTVIDNLKISTPLPKELNLTASKANIFVGESLTVTPTAYRNGLPLNSADGITYSVLDSEGLPIIDGSVTVNDKGEVNVTSFAAAQIITIRAQSPTGAKADCQVNVQSADMFTITNIGINEEHETDPRIVKLYVTKEFNYTDSVVFLITVYDDNGILKGVNHLNKFGDSMSVGENELTLDYKLPDGFNPDTWHINVMAWTSLG